MADRSLDVQIITWRPDMGLLVELLDSLSEQRVPGWKVNLHVLDNSVDETVATAIAQRLQARASFCTLAPVDFTIAQTNAGFGCGHNALLERGDAPLVLLLNQDVVLEPGALGLLLEAAE